MVPPRDATSPPPGSAPAPPDPDPYAGRPARVFVGLSFAATTGVASHVVASPGVFVEASLPPDGVLAPALRLSLDRVAGATQLARGGWLARFDRTLVHLDAVALRLPIGPVDLAPAIALGVGALAAEGRVGPVVVARTRPWVEASVGARARLWLLGRVSLEVDGGIAFPFVRDTFAFDPAITVDRTPAAAAFVGGAASLRAW